MTSWSRRDFLRLTGAAALGGLGAAPWPGGAALATALAGSELDELYAGLQLCWGDIHAHTGYSDGFGTPALSLDEARRLKGLQFAAVTDHSEWLRYFEQRLAMADGSPVPLWQTNVAAADARNAPGAFVTLPAFEWTNDQYGHRNVYFRSSQDMPAVPPTPITHPTPDALWAALAPHRALVVPHHPTRWGKLMNWDHYDPAFDRLVEIYSKWGNGASVWTPYETPTAYRRNPLLRPLAEASGVDAMLERSGYRIGIVAGSDCHQGVLGSTAAERPRGRVLQKSQYPRSGEEFLHLLDAGYTFDHREPKGGGGGLAAAWVPQLTREAVFDALYARHTYGTSGIRPAIRTAVRDGANWANFALMGDDITIRGVPRILVDVRPEPGSDVTEIQLLNFNRVIATWRHPAAGVMLGYEDVKLPPGQPACYRLLVLVKQASWFENADGDTTLDYDAANDRFVHTLYAQLSEQVWTSPMWVTRQA